VTHLLDVNVLIALLDQDHIYHDRAENWFADEGSADWATCPLTENGAVRILGHSRYPKGPGNPAAVAALLIALRQVGGHSFWTDDISLFDTAYVKVAAIGSAAQVTDTYLLALAASRGGMLATLDRRLSAAAVPGGTKALHLIG
jgi:toxin-antitoxin system PIN domain toxin